MCLIMLSSSDLLECILHYVVATSVPDVNHDLLLNPTVGVVCVTVFADNFVVIFRKCG